MAHAINLNELVCHAEAGTARPPTVVHQYYAVVAALVGQQDTLQAVQSFRRTS